MRHPNGCYADEGKVVMVMDVYDARTLAEMYGYRDGAWKELNDAADRAEAYLTPDPDAPGLYIVVVENDGTAHKASF